MDQIDKKKEASRNSDAFLSAKIAFLAVLCIALCIFVGNTVNRIWGAASEAEYAADYALFQPPPERVLGLRRRATELESSKSLAVFAG